MILLLALAGCLEYQLSGEELDCGFSTSDGITQQSVYTQSQPTFTALQDDIVLYQGEVVEYKLKAAAHACGAVDLHMLPFEIYDPDGESWMQRVADNEEIAILVNESDNDSYEPVASGSFDHGSSDSLIYTWHDEVWENFNSVGQSMPTVRLERGKEKTFAFYFPHTDYAPGGTIADLSLKFPLWTDVSTETMVWWPDLEVWDSTSTTLVILEP